MTPKTYTVILTYEELLRLDGQVRAPIQQAIDEAKAVQSFGFGIPLMGEILQRSLTRGILTRTRVDIRTCGYCDKQPIYAPYSRNSSGHRKGDPRYDKPLYYDGVAYNGSSSVTALCAECDARLQIMPTLVRYIREHCLPIEIRIPGIPTDLFQDHQYQCFQCHELMWESEMTWEYRGSSWKRVGCPRCGAVEFPWGGQFHKTSQTFRMVSDNPQVRRPGAV